MKPGNENDEFELAEDERNFEPIGECWEDVAADEAGVPRFGEI